MKKHFLGLFAMLSLMFHAHSQELLGLSTGNYTGVSGMNLNPASIVDSRLKFDLNLIGFSTYFSNNYLSVKRTALLDGSFFKDKYKDWALVQRDLLEENKLSANERVNIRLNTRVIAPVSFMLSVGKKSAIGLSITNRTGMYVNNINQDFARFAYSSFNDNSFFGQTMNMNGISSNTLNWLDVGLTYGTVLIDKGNHFLKAAFTAKYMGGIASGYFQADELSMNFSNSQDVNVTTPYMQYGHSNKLSLDMYKSLSLKSLRPEAEGFGWNAGLLYEYRGKIDKFRYLTPEHEEKTRRDYNKYTFRIGFAIMDAGKLTFNKGGFNNDFAMNAVNWNLNNRTIKDINSVDTLLSEQAAYNTLAEVSYTVALPTAYSAQLDVHMGRGFYINAMTYQPLKLMRTDQKVSVQPAYAVTPRFESRVFGFYMPVSYNTFDKWNLGATLRLGPLYLGSANLASLVFNKKVTAADIHAGIRIPIAYGSPSKVAKLFDQLSKKKEVKERVFVPVSMVKDSIITLREKQLDSLKSVLNNLEKQRLIDSVRLSYLQLQQTTRPATPPVTITINNYSGNPDRSTVIMDTTLLKRNSKDSSRIISVAQTDTLIRLLAQKELQLKQLEITRQQRTDTIKVAPDTATKKIITIQELKIDTLQKAKTITPQSQNDALRKEIELLRNAINNNRGQTITVSAPIEKDTRYNNNLEDEINRLRTELNIHKQNTNTKSLQPDTGLHRATDTVYINDTIRIVDTIQKIVSQTKVVKEYITPAVVDNSFENLLNLPLENILFRVNEISIRPVHYASLNFIAENLKKHPALALKIDGYTDKTGPVAVNEKLSKQRAESVRNYLLKRNVSGTKLQINNHGSNEPVAENSTRTGQALNRRVELQFVKS